uniref:RNA-directed DNA polymerase n=1 Tax=Anopheles stephensi TaxID=30069 RepID=A0A182YRA1_ANOST
MSRLPITSTDPESEIEEPDVVEQFSLQKDFLMRGSRVYIPPTLRMKVLRELHSTYFGTSRMKFLARSYCWWEGIDRDIENLMNDCISFQSAKANPPKISFHCWEQPTEPFQRIHVHYSGPFMGFYYLILANAYSKWPSEYVVKSMTTEITIRLCREFFSAYGLPSVLVSHNGPQFTSVDFAQFAQ